MSITTVNTWSSGDKFTAAQANSIDTKLQTAVDKTTAGDTVSGVLTMSGIGGIIPTIETGADADTTYAISDGIGIIITGALTANRNYTLSNTGAAAGRTVLVVNSGTTYDVIVKNAAGAALLTIGAGNTVLNQSRWGEFYHNGSAWILLRSSFAPQQLRQVFTADGTYTVPADCYKLMVVGCGGGGGGGGACGANTSTTALASAGGGGGGAAQMGVTWVNTTPGATFAVTRGTGGGGGAGGNVPGGSADTAGGAGADGSDGTDTTFGTTVSFHGAQGGRGAPVSVGTPASNVQHVPGGGPVKGGTKPYVVTLPVAHTTITGVCIPGQGGYGISAQTGILTAAAGAYPVTSSTTGGSGTTTPGAGGAQGATVASYLSGGGGGGGGANAFASGGTGGAGGTANNGGTDGAPGTAGTVGSGGGGGGAGGAFLYTSQVGDGPLGGAGGAGGDGVLVVIPIR